MFFFVFSFSGVELFMRMIRRGVGSTFGVVYENGYTDVAIRRTPRISKVVKRKNVDRRSERRERPLWSCGGEVLRDEKVFVARSSLIGQRTRGGIFKNRHDRRSLGDGWRHLLVILVRCANSLRDVDDKPAELVGTEGNARERDSKKG